MITKIIPQHRKIALCLTIKCFFLITRHYLYAHVLAILHQRKQIASLTLMTIHGICKHRTSYIPPHSKLFRSDVGRFQVEYLPRLLMNGLETNCVVTPRCLAVWKQQQNILHTVSWYLICKYSTTCYKKTHNR